jgi:hypothetical protein
MGGILSSPHKEVKPLGGKDVKATFESSVKPFLDQAEYIYRTKR